MPSISLPLAFVAGLLSMLSPCVFSLVPIYLGYLSGASIMGNQQRRSWRVFSHALVFVFGFTLIFVVVMGLPTTLLSGALQRHGVWIERLGGFVLILFGLHTAQIVNIPLFNVTHRAELGRELRPGYLRSLLFGATFATGWSPCVGPLLGMVMTLSFTEPGRAMLFMLAYAMGIATPFLLAALLISRMLGWIDRLARYAETIERVSSALMLAVGVLLITGLFRHINDWLIQFTPTWLIEHL